MSGCHRRVGGGRWLVVACRAAERADHRTPSTPDVGLGRPELQSLQRAGAPTELLALSEILGRHPHRPIEQPGELWLDRPVTAGPSIKLRSACRTRYAVNPTVPGDQVHRLWPADLLCDIILVVSRSVPAGPGSRPPSTLASYVTEEIRSGILEGRYPLGSRLDQQTLADELGASVIPVRESLRQLEAEGLILIAPRRGAYVVSPTAEEVREVYRLRAVFEAFATKEAVPALAGPDLEELDGLLVQMARHGRSNTYENWSQLNQKWHFALYRGASSPLLMQFISTLWDRCRLTSNVYARDLSHRSRSNEDHSRIMAAVHAGEAERAADLIAVHVRNAMDDILDKDMIGQAVPAASPSEP